MGVTAQHQIGAACGCFICTLGIVIHDDHGMIVRVPGDDHLERTPAVWFTDRDGIIPPENDQGPQSQPAIMEHGDSAFPQKRAKAGVNRGGVVISGSKYYAVRGLNAPELCGCGLPVKIGSGLTAVKEISRNYHQVWLCGVDRIHNRFQVFGSVVDAEVDITEQHYAAGMSAVAHGSGIMNRNNCAGMNNAIEEDENRAAEGQAEPRYVPWTIRRDPCHGNRQELKQQQAQDPVEKKGDVQSSNIQDPFFYTGSGSGISNRLIKTRPPSIKRRSHRPGA